MRAGRKRGAPPVIEHADRHRSTVHNRTITMSRRFTPSQATRTLPLVRPIVAEILEKGRELRAIAEESPKPGQRERVGTLEGAMRDLFLELERIGCAYKDFGFDKGLV